MGEVLRQNLPQNIRNEYKIQVHIEKLNIGMYRNVIITVPDHHKNSKTKCCHSLLCNICKIFLPQNHYKKHAQET